MARLESGSGSAAGRIAGDFPAVTPGFRLTGRLVCPRVYF